MTTNNAIHEHARKLADIFDKMDALREEAKAATEIAEQQGISAKALRKVAKEMIMDSTKLRKRLDDEEQLDMFRSAVGLIEAKGLAA